VKSHELTLTELVKCKNLLKIAELAEGGSKGVAFGMEGAAGTVAKAPTPPEYVSVELGSSEQVRRTYSDRKAGRKPKYQGEAFRALGACCTSSFSCIFMQKFRY
jgi:hypothetical protein